MSDCRRNTWLGCVLSLVAMLTAGTAIAKIVKSSDVSFTIEHEVLLPVPPEEAYDAMTGDISGWWDHKFSDNPAAYYIEAKPGGGFLEIFDESGDGALHATVTYAHRGKLLRYEGPLGLAGNPFTMVMTFVYEWVGTGTLVKFTAHSMGVMEPGWDQAVDGVWHHFLVEQLKPYVESGKHKSKSTSR